MLQLIGFIFFGVIVGLIARMITPGQRHMGFWMTSLLGMFGSLIAGYTGQVLNWYQPGQPAGFIASTLGAVIILLIYHAIMKKRSLSGRIADSARNAIS